MNTVIAEFRQRVEGIAFQGIGLSVDAYSPDIFELMDSLGAGSMTPGYLEVFRAATPMLLAIRRRYPSISLPYHAEGLWWTEPDWRERPGTAKELELVVEQASALGSPWINHECASKRLGPYAFGTYLPPLFTSDSARVVARHVAVAQEIVDRALGRGRGDGPLVLLELPPLTYFRAGDLDAAAFFAEIAQGCPCGLVLDIGHLWTHYRYSAATSRIALPEFIAGFLDEFPLERVVEIHVAGLSAHPVVPDDPIALHADLPLWLDDHAAPIPEILFDMLEQVLSRPNLSSLRGVGLEVDTKPVKLISHEFEQFLLRFGNTVDACRRQALEHTLSSDPLRTPALSVTTGTPRSDERLSETARRYADLIVGLPGPNGAIPMLPDCDEAPFRWYREGYLPHEILFWGGDLRSMFPRTCERLREAACPFEDFVAFWLACREELLAPFDFFLLKLERFTRFVLTRCPEAGELVRQEAAELRDAYEAANLPAGCESAVSLMRCETETDR
jgi:uncharacterized protein (UPF0276 family)